MVRKAKKRLIAAGFEEVGRRPSCVVPCVVRVGQVSKFFAVYKAPITPHDNYPTLELETFFALTS